ncbi:MAG: hypothetical protein DMF81_10325 [Acidobacteria bacterium]|nr:MAG: hypothetical protein DMF81_10325 [Acidobacteriota bacterium]
MKKTTLGCLLAALWAGLAAGAGSEDTDKKPVPLYTNDDLRRVSPHRDETGVNSRPAAAVPPAPAPAGTAAKGRVQGEEYWRREADRLRDRLRPLRERADDLRLAIDERRRKPRVHPYSDPHIVAWERRLRMLDDRIREAESRLEERARREGAMPGWMR